MNDNHVKAIMDTLNHLEGVQGKTVEALARLTTHLDTLNKRLSRLEQHPTNKYTWVLQVSVVVVLYLLFGAW